MGPVLAVPVVAETLDVDSYQSGKTPSQPAGCRGARYARTCAPSRNRSVTISADGLARRVGPLENVDVPIPRGRGNQWARFLPAIV